MKRLYGMFAVVLSVVGICRADPDGGGWRLQVGGVRQWTGGVSVQGPALSLMNDSWSSLPIGGAPHVSGTLSPTYPDSTLPIPRLFGDGYVYPDYFSSQGQLDPNGQLTTFNWGYQDASQYHTAPNGTQVIDFHIDRGVEADSTGATADSGHKDLGMNGIELKAVRRVATWWNDGELGVVLGLALFPETQQTVRQTDTFNLNRVTETYTYLDYYSAYNQFPVAPYQWNVGAHAPDGNHFGSVDNPGAGYALPLLPDPSYPATITRQYLGTAVDSASIETRLWRLRGEVGPTLSKPLTDRLSVYLAPQLALEFVDASVSRVETVNYTDATTPGVTSRIATRNDSRNEVTVIPGFLLTGGADFRITENWYVGGSLGWEWLTREVSMHAGPDRVRFDLAGGEVSVYLGRRF